MEEVSREISREINLHRINEAQIEPHPMEGSSQTSAAKKIDQKEKDKTALIVIETNVENLPKGNPIRVDSLGESVVTQAEMKEAILAEMEEIHLEIKHGRIEVKAKNVMKNPKRALLMGYLLHPMTA